MIKKNENDSLKSKEQLCKELAEFRKIFSALEGQSLDGWWDRDLLQDKEYMSPRFKKIFGYEDHELPNKRESWQKLMFQEDLPKVLENFEKHFASKGAHPFMQEVRYHHKDGSTVWVLCRGQVIEWTENGEAKRIIGTHTDITELKNNAKKLTLLNKELEIKFNNKVKEIKRLASIVNSSIDAVISKTLDGKITYWNKAAENIYGYPRDEAIGKNINLIIPEELRTQELVVFNRVKSGEKMPQYDTKRIKKNGEFIDISVALSLVKDEDSKAHSISSISRDITDKKILEHQLTEKNRELVKVNQSKDEFLANASHELRSPINVIIGFLDLMKDLPPTSEKFDIYLDTISNNSHSLLHLIEDLLDISRIVSGKLSLDADIFDINYLLNQAVQTFQVAADAKGISLEVQLSDPPLNFVCDPDRFNQVLCNLISNAIKFTPSDGTIKVSAEHINCHLILKVQDSGIGIDKKDLPHIFERLWQKSVTKNRFQKGMGLGLSISEEIVELHGGTIQVQSDGINCGSTFTVKIPIRAVEPSMEKATLSENGKDLPLDGLCILVVDDMKDALKLITLVLENSGAKVLTAEDGNEALKIIANEETIHVVVSDIGMPGMDGYHFVQQAQKLCQKLKLKPKPMLALTAYCGENEKNKALKSGFNAHLIKPIKKEILIENILKWVH